MIFLVNRMGDVHVIDAEFIQLLQGDQFARLYRECAWCPDWLAASELSRKRRRAIEALRRT